MKRILAYQSLLALGVLSALCLLLLVQKEDAQLGYLVNYETRYKAKSIPVDNINYVELTGPHFWQDGRSTIIKDRGEIGRILDAFKSSCRSSDNHEEILEYGCPDIVLYWPRTGANERGAIFFELDGTRLLEERGPSVQAALKKYLNARK